MTLLDYPQKVAAIIFTSGCNMRCPFCYNPNLVLPELISAGNPMPEDYVFEYLNRRRKYLDGAVISGGEPTIQADLAAFLAEIKKIDYSVKLDTNGLLPDVLKKLIEAGLIDYLAMDIKAPLGRYLEICGQAVAEEAIKESVKIIRDSGLPHEFRSTLIKGFHQKEDLTKMVELIAGAQTYYLQNFSPQGELIEKNYTGASFSVGEMAEFRDLASRFVENCVVR